MAILKKGIITKDSTPDLGELRNSLRDLPDGEYAFYVCDKKKNKTMPMLKYLFGVVLKEASNASGFTPEDLYQIYEEKFAPYKVVEMDGKEYMVRCAKKLPRDEFAAWIEKIIEHSNTFFNTQIEARSELSKPELQEAYVGYYNDMWDDFNRKI